MHLRHKLEKDARAKWRSLLRQAGDDVGLVRAATKASSEHAFVKECLARYTEAMVESAHNYKAIKAGLTVNE